MIFCNKKIEQVNLNKIVEEKIHAKSFDKLLIVVPTNRKRRQLRKEFISKVPGQATEQLNIETLSTLLTQLLSATKTFYDLSDPASTVLLKKSIDETDLKYFKNFTSNFPDGTLEKIKSVISKYKKNGLTPDDLINESCDGKISEKNKADDIAGIYTKYLQKCEKLNSFEIGDIYTKTLALNETEFNDSFIKIFPSVNIILLEGFDEFTPLEIELIIRLSKPGEVTLFISLDYDEDNHYIFSHLSDCYSILSKKRFLRSRRI